MHRALLSLALLAVLFSASPVLAGNMPTHNCTQLGTTMMSDNKENIIACTLVTGTTGAAPSCTDNAGVANSKCKWKSMSGGEVQTPSQYTLAGTITNPSVSNLGVHRLCVLSSGEQGGGDAWRCSVEPSGSEWLLKAANGDRFQVTCGATCFD